MLLFQPPACRACAASFRIEDIAEEQPVEAENFLPLVFFPTLASHWNAHLLNLLYRARVTNSILPFLYKA